MRPTLSVLLPTHNRCWTLGRQLDCILPQLGPEDEVVVYANGCTDSTDDVLDTFDDDRLYIYQDEDRVGVCKAYNFCAHYANSDWVLGCNDHNELLPGAIEAWREMAIKYPDQRVMHGRIDAMPRMGWIEGGGPVAKESIPLLCCAKQWITHGAETFIRRDSWGAGYRTELEWMADQEQSMTLALRYGVCDLHHIVSHVEFRPGNYSQAHGNKDRFNKVIRAWRALIDTEDFQDVRDLYLMIHQITGHFNERA